MNEQIKPAEKVTISIETLRELIRVGTNSGYGVRHTMLMKPDEYNHYMEFKLVNDCGSTYLFMTEHIDDKNGTSEKSTKIPVELLFEFDDLFIKAIRKLKENLSAKKQ